MKGDSGVINKGARNPNLLLTEDEVIAAVREYLSEAGWDIRAWALATEQGDDIVAEKEGRRLIIEAKGEGSSKSHTARFGSSFSPSQVNNHVSRAVYRALRTIAGDSVAGVAFPDGPLHRSAMGAIQPVTSKLGIAVFWVDRLGQVSAE